jgi:hypothetical protein
MFTQSRSQPRVIILAYHSQAITGMQYENNEHVAFRSDVALLRRRAIPVLRLSHVVDLMRTGRFSRLPPKSACLTIDDGHDYDYLPVSHYTWGPQESMARILASAPRTSWQRVTGQKLSATSFVIASPDARRQIAGDVKDNPDRMADDWWAAAQASGNLDIGTHSWDHVHPWVKEVQSRPHVMEAFQNVDSPEEAEFQVAKACRFVMSKTGHDAARLFAYPFGQVSEYLVREYLPSQTLVRAAVTTEPAPVHADTSVWRIPRYVCGAHWKSEAELDRILAAE